MSHTRRHFSAEQKAQVVRRHLAGKEAVSDLAGELKIQPILIHLWVKQVLELVERAFEKSPGHHRATQAKDQRIGQLEAKIVQKNEVIAELMEENVRAKKATGGL
ncbi:MAG: transposase [Planctomycetes bacterium]|nr:transposase [Planctomycetota bacterium]